MKAHYLLVFIFIVALIPMVSAQQIIRQTICSVGMNTNSGNFVLKQTIGQPSNTSTFKTESGMLRQGFQQPAHINRAIVHYENPIEMQLYPNPAENSFTLLIVGDDLRFSAVALDITGKTLLNMNMILNQKTVVDCSGWAPGLYFINIYSDSRLIASKKIVKTI
ncbi:MAG: T9SS type A sorting domain-containing protein [Bacteroidales bacterium]|nr:T9SS type A sorting domain-containing protein [Bacteroidales bacterium]HOY39406.1 T9SS type A sorting domain-containing protein [Bacteroidales bacterium]HQP03417.1 T9SS type A sorting domain-containing protein [Bacteroidales bacterium]